MPKRISRRKFIGTSLAATGGAASALALAGCGSKDVTSELIDSASKVSPQAEIEYLDVDPAQVLSYIDMDETSPEEYLKLTNSFDLPLGSLIYQSSNTQALVLSPGANSNALIRLGLVNLDSGQHSVILGQALGHNEDYIIYDARASQNALIWVECNMVHGLWRVFAVPIIDGAVTEAAAMAAPKLDEGESTYEPPLLAAAQGKVYWTVMPDPNGSAATEDSLLKCADISEKSAQQAPTVRTIYNSPGRMITTPQISGDTLTIVPRVEADTIFYQLTAISTKDDQVLNAAILPQSLRVSDAVWLDDGFAFGIEDNYDYAKGLAFFGTYKQLGEGRYLYVNKVPTSAPANVNSILYVKSTKNVVGLDIATGHSFIVATLPECVSYGDVLAGSGLHNRLVTYTTVTNKIGQDKGICRVRVFDRL